MHWEEKLDFVLDYLKIQNTEVAKEFGVSNGAVSQWRNWKCKRLNRVHLMGFETVFNIPLYIFEDENINSKEEIIKVLNNKKIDFNSKNSCTLSGEWNLYFNYINKLSEFKLLIDKNNLVELQSKSRVYKGTILDFTLKEILIVVEDRNESFVIIIDKSSLNNLLFNVLIYHKNLFTPQVDIGVVSLNPLKRFELKTILNQTDIKVSKDINIEAKLKYLLNSKELIA